MLEELADTECLLQEPFVGINESEQGVVQWAIQWSLESSGYISESYVNLVPTPLGGTHVNGLRQGLLVAVREFCELRGLCPRGVSIKAEDVFSSCHYICSVKLNDVQFAGQTKEKLTSRHATGMVAKVIEDALSLWLNKNPDQADVLVTAVIEAATKRERKAKRSKERLC